MILHHGSPRPKKSSVNHFRGFTFTSGLFGTLLLLGRLSALFSEEGDGGIEIKYRAFIFSISALYISTIRAPLFRNKFSFPHSLSEKARL